MLKKMESTNEKIAMGFLSLSSELSSTEDVLEEMNWYKQANNRHLYLYKVDNMSDYIGLIGVEITENVVLIRQLTLSPSYRGEGYRFKMLDELDSLYQNEKKTSTLENSQLLVEWQQRKDKEDS